MSSKRVAQNLIRTYGMPMFLRLVELFRANESGPVIAAEFKVTRQRVHQWKKVLGQERTIFILDPEVEALMGTPSGRTTV
jgi:hypothetical protein